MGFYITLTLTLNSYGVGVGYRTMLLSIEIDE